MAPSKTAFFKGVGSRGGSAFSIQRTNFEVSPFRFMVFQLFKQSSIGRDISWSGNVAVAFE